MANKFNWTAFTGVAMVIVIAFVVLAVTGVVKLAPQTALGGGQPSGTPYISTGSTALNFVATDKLLAGTSVSGTPMLSLGGQAFKSGITTASPNEVYDIVFLNGTTYHNAYLTGHKVPQSPTDNIYLTPYKNASLTITMFNTDNDKMIDGGGATGNQTVATGGSYNMAIRLDGQDKTSTQDMVAVVEADGTKADSMTLTGFGATFKSKEKPSSYTLVGTNSQVWVYEVSPITGAVSPSGTVGVVSKTSQSLTGTTFKVTFMTKEHFIDSSTGKYMYATEDTLGTRQSMAVYTFTGAFT